MTLERMSAARVAALRQTPFNYDDVGRSWSGAAPRGYHTFRRPQALERRDWAAVVDDLMTWQVPQRSGLRVAVSSDRVAFDELVSLRVGFGVLGVTAPCRVVYVVDEPDRRGFAYGTLSGHPEAGEESFVLTHAPDGVITFTITAFSRPATSLAKLSGRLGRATQRRITDRYLASLER